MTLEKGRKVATLYQGDTLILSSDQTALFAGEVIQKPGTIEKALTQLMGFSGNTVTFLTGVAITRAGDMYSEYRLVPFQVTFKELTQEEILHYLAKESVLDCAGSFKCEGLGIRLFKKMTGDDPTALEGLPLIATTELLVKFGMDPLS
jgi:MAF protein